MAMFHFLQSALHPRIRVTLKPDGRKVIYLSTNQSLKASRKQ